MRMQRLLSLQYKIIGMPKRWRIIPIAEEKQTTLDPKSKGTLTQAKSSTYILLEEKLRYK